MNSTLRDLNAGLMRIRCPNCRTILTVPDSAAGKRARCSECRGEMEIPRTVQGHSHSSDDFEDYEDYGEPADRADPDAELFRNLPALENPTVRSPAEEMPCPACRQQIPRWSERCPFCDHHLDVPAPARKRKKRKPSKEEILSKQGPSFDSDLSTTDILVSVFCGLIGVALALSYIISGDSKGWKMLLISFVINVVAAAIIIGTSARG